MKLYVITVTYNNLIELEQTYLSLVQRLNYSDVKWIVIDGNSNDGTDAFLKGLPNVNFDVQFTSEPDKGLYDAMNKGISLIQKDGFVWFLNAGDLANESFYSEWQKVKDYGKPLIIGSSKRFSEDGSSIYFKKPKPISHIRKGMICEHQAILFHSALLNNNKIRYDLRYSLSSDYDFIIQCLNKVDIDAIHYSNTVFCEFRFGGVSKTRRNEGILEGSLIRLRRLKMGIFSVLFLATLHVLWDKYKNLTGSIR